jgi:hypothetical protein
MTKALGDIAKCRDGPELTKTRAERNEGDADDAPGSPIT